MINSQIEILTQAQSYLTTVSYAEYNEIIKPNFISAAGAHIRHIIDHYQAIIASEETQLINYDTRSRGTSIETNPAIANAKIKEIIPWLKQLTPVQLQQKVSLSTEVSISTKEIHIVQTTLARELIFVASHAVHHYAMISQIMHAQAKHNKKSLPSQYFGLAPATATYLREAEQH